MMIITLRRMEFKALWYLSEMDLVHGSDGVHIARDHDYP